MRHIAIDSFAGGGGASEGLRMAGINVGIAINHDPEAIRMHAANHPDALHLTEDVFKVNLSEYIRPDDVVDVMWASPDCTSHSKAKGGQPREQGAQGAAVGGIPALQANQRRHGKPSQGPLHGECRGDSGLGAAR